MPDFGDHAHLFEQIQATTDAPPGDHDDLDVSDLAAELGRLAHAAPIDWSADPATAMIHTVITGLADRNGQPDPGRLLALAHRHRWNDTTITRLAAAAALFTRLAGGDLVTDERLPADMPDRLPGSMQILAMLRADNRTWSIKDIYEWAIRENLARRASITEWVSHLFIAGLLTSPQYGHYRAAPHSPGNPTAREIEALLTFLLDSDERVAVTRVKVWLDGTRAVFRIRPSHPDRHDISAVVAALPQLSAATGTTIAWEEISPTSAFLKVTSGSDGPAWDVNDPTPGYVTVGADADGADVAIPLRTTVVFGDRGAGKSNLLGTIAAAAAADPDNVLWAGSTTGGFPDGFWRDEHGRPVVFDRIAATEASITAMLTEAELIMNERKFNATRNIPYRQRLLIVLDDLEYLASVPAVYRIMRVGPAVNIHCIAAAQRGSSNILRPALVRRTAVLACGEIEDDAERAYTSGLDDGDPAGRYWFTFQYRGRMVSAQTREVLSQALLAEHPRPAGLPASPGYDPAAHRRPDKVRVRPGGAPAPGQGR
jgi:hypothetical protein